MGPSPSDLDAARPARDVDCVETPGWYNGSVTIHEHSCGDVVVLDVAGTPSVPDLARPVRTAVQALVRDHRTQIVLNMARVPHLDSTGLADVIEAFHAASRAGGSLKLAHLTPRVRDLLAPTALLNVFEVFDCEADAVASFGGASNTAATIT